MKQIPVIIDCDTGADDALGLFLALYSKSLNILGITSVCGNTTARQTALNCTRVLRLAGRRDVMVYIGANQPLERTLTFSTKYSGNDGLCDTGLSDAPQYISDKSACDFLIETLGSASEPVTLIATAGFTNLAMALKKNPYIVSGIHEIVAASGYFGLNDRECRAEWNIEVDPEAADIVYRSGVQIRAMGLEISSMLEDSQTEMLLKSETSPDKEKILDFLRGCDKFNQKLGNKRSSLLADGMATAAVICPDIAKYVSGTAKVNPEMQGAELITFTRGNGNIRVAEVFDSAQYLTMLKGMLTS